MVAPLALWTYVLGNGKDETAAKTIRDQSVAAADQIAARTSHHPYRISLTTRDYIWGSNAVAANYSMQLLIANQFHPAPDTFRPQSTICIIFWAATPFRFPGSRRLAKTRFAILTIGQAQPTASICHGRDCWPAARIQAARIQ